MEHHDGLSLLLGTYALGITEGHTYRERHTVPLIADSYEIAFVDVIIGFDDSGAHNIRTVGDELDCTHINGYKTLLGLEFVQTSDREEWFAFIDHSQDVVPTEKEVEIRTLGYVQRIVLRESLSAEECVEFLCNGLDLLLSHPLPFADPDVCHYH